MKSKWLVFTAILACAGCCAIPLSTIIWGISSASLLAAAMNGKYLELLFCVIPLLIMFLFYWMYKRHQTKMACCTSPQQECNENKCAHKR